MGTKKKKENPKEEQETPNFRSFVGASNKFKPAQELYNGFEIEKRWVLLTKEKDYTKGGNGLERYDEVMDKGELYEQGYIHDLSIAREMLEELGIELAPEFKPNTVRLRRIGQNQCILTLKDRKETKKREVEWEIDKKAFSKFWKLTEGSRVLKKRLKKKVKGNLIEFDAFLDRFLIMAECEVQSEADLENLPKLGMDVTGQKPWTNKTLAK